MKTTPDTAEECIETFGETCAKLAALEHARASVLRAAGVAPARWEVVAAAWNTRMATMGDESRDLSEHFRRSYNLTAAEVGVPEWPEAQVSVPKPANVAPPPLLQTPSFLLPPPPPARSPRGESPWACTVQVPVNGASECQGPLPFRPGAPSILTATARPSPVKKEWTGPGTGTLALAEIAPLAPANKLLALAPTPIGNIAPAQAQPMPCSETAPSAFAPPVQPTPFVPVVVALVPAPAKPSPPAAAARRPHPAQPAPTVALADRPPAHPAQPAPTVALADIPPAHLPRARNVRASPPVQGARLPPACKITTAPLDDEDTERTMMGLPAQWPPRP